MLYFLTGDSQGGGITSSDTDAKGKQKNFTFIKLPYSLPPSLLSPSSLPPLPPSLPPSLLSLPPSLPPYLPPSLSHQVHLLSVFGGDKSREKYVGTVDVLVSACRQIREEVSSMEEDILLGQNMADFLEKSRPHTEKAIKELQMAATMASGEREGGREAGRRVGGEGWRGEGRE